jgi:hypothetical protein
VTGVQTCALPISLPAGFREASTCAATDDCDDASAAKYQLLTVRADQDGDGYCAWSPYTKCTGAAPLAVSRLASACAGDDCRDTNYLATTVCSIPWGTSAVTKSCGIGPPPSETFNVSVTDPFPSGCPAGFQLDGSFSGQQTGGALSGWCAPVSGQPTRLTMTCPSGSFGSFSCRVVGTCVAQ